MPHFYVIPVIGKDQILECSCIPRALLGAGDEQATFASERGSAPTYLYQDVTDVVLRSAKNDALQGGFLTRAVRAVKCLSKEAKNFGTCKHVIQFVS